MSRDQDTNNVYMVTVVANDGTNTAMMDVAVTVANVDEAGVITLNPDRPGSGSMITATLTDPDGDTSNVVWGWQRSTNRELGWNSIPDATSDTYTLVAADVDHYLRAVATYTDPEGTGKRAEQATTGVVGMRPTFAGETATRTVPENSVMGVAVGAPVTAAAADNYRLGGADAASFAIGGTTGQIMTKAAMDFETKASYTVTVTASDTAGASGEITVTITVENVEEMGEVTFSAHPVVGIEVTARVTDPDVADQDTVMWRWARSMDMMDWMDIAGETMNTYTPTMADDGYYLRVTAMYTDGHGPDKEGMATSAGLVSANNAPVFQDAQGMDITVITRNVAENTAADEDVGAPVTAMDADNDTLTYSLGGTDAESFDIDSATGQITVGQGTTLDADTKATYTVIVTATDSDGLSDAITVTITVTMMTAGLPGDTNNDGMIDKPEVIAAFRAYVEDPSDKAEIIGIFRQYVTDAAGS